MIFTATYGLLKHFDYISTVSGGGYIASWLISWIKRPGKETRNLSGIEFVEEELRKAPPEFAPDKVEKYEEPGAINFLRSYSNYLTPRLGIFGADTWTAVASYFRNLLLNQAIGGTSGGDPSKTEFPVRLEVDWVRVFSRNGRDR